MQEHGPRAGHREEESHSWGFPGKLGNRVRRSECTSHRWPRFPRIPERISTPEIKFLTTGMLVVRNLKVNFKGRLSTPGQGAVARLTVGEKCPT